MFISSCPYRHSLQLSVVLLFVDRFSPQTPQCILKLFSWVNSHVLFIVQCFFFFFKEVYFLNVISRTSQVVQWLRIGLPVQGTWAQSLVLEDPTCYRTTKPCVPQLLSPYSAREATVMRSLDTASRGSPTTPKKTQHSHKQIHTI